MVLNAVINEESLCSRMEAKLEDKCYVVVNAPFIFISYEGNDSAIICE